MQNIQFIQLLSDIGAGKRGTVHGVKWLAEQLNLNHSAIFSNHSDSHFPSPPAKYIDNLTAFFEKTLPALVSLYQQPAFPIILSGDHSNAMVTLAAFRQANPNKRIGIIWIDAHADLHTPYTTPSGNLHGMTLSTAINEDNLAHAHQDLSPEVVDYWQRLKNLASTSQAVQPQDICFLGLRSYEPEEQALLERFAIPHYSVEEIRCIGLDSVLEKIKQQFADVDLLYISWDVDSLDQALIGSTGTPEENGFSETEIRELFRQLLRLPTLAAFEITEFNPTLSDNPEEHQRILRLLNEVIEQLS